LDETREKNIEKNKPKNIKSSSEKSEIIKLISDLRKIMTRKVGILRDAKGLKEAGEFVNLYLGSEYLYNKKDKDILEFTNMLEVASLIIKAARLRKESRGTHQRNDFLKKDDKNWKKHIILRQDRVYFKKV
jgi:succinate dehydrogenase/fumarate reductase flavoprotein subunit